MLPPASPATGVRWAWCAPCIFLKKDVSLKCTKKRPPGATRVRRQSRKTCILKKLLCPLLGAPLAKILAKRGCRTGKVVVIEVREVLFVFSVRLGLFGFFGFRLVGLFLRRTSRPLLLRSVWHLSRLLSCLSTLRDEVSTFKHTFRGG